MMMIVYNRTIDTFYSATGKFDEPRQNHLTSTYVYLPTYLGGLCNILVLLKSAVSSLSHFPSYEIKNKKSFSSKIALLRKCQIKSDLTALQPPSCKIQFGVDQKAKVGLLKCCLLFRFNYKQSRLLECCLLFCFNYKQSRLLECLLFASITRHSRLLKCCLLFLLQLQNTLGYSCSTYTKRKFQKRVS